MQNHGNQVIIIGKNPAKLHILKNRKQNFAELDILITDKAECGRKKNRKNGILHFLGATENAESDLFISDKTEFNEIGKKWNLRNFDFLKPQKRKIANLTQKHHEISRRNPREMRNLLNSAV